jgi:hypothetical protein
MVDSAPTNTSVVEKSFISFAIFAPRLVSWEANLSHASQVGQALRGHLIEYPAPSGRLDGRPRFIDGQSVRHPSSNARAKCPLQNVLLAQGLHALLGDITDERTSHLTS